MGRPLLQGSTSRHGLLKRAAFGVGGGALVVVGIALLVLPGPGLLLVLGGLLLLAEAFPAVERFVDPIEHRAIRAMEESVRTPLRVVGSVLAGLGLIAAGVGWGVRLVPWLPLPGWSTGSSLILSGLILLGLVAFSVHRVHLRGSRG